MSDSLTSAQRAALRSMGRRRSPDAQVGKDGVDEGAVRHLRAMLAQRELIKVRLLPAAGDRAAAAEMLAQALAAECVDLVGRMVVLYRPNPTLPPGKRIQME